MAIVRKEAYYTSSNGINQVRTLIWNNEGMSPKGVIQIAHGLAEHIGRYDELARFLAENGYIVCGNDHLGHGKTVGSINDLGFVYEGDHVNMIRDMNTLYKIMHRRYPDLPYFLFGHSMGSFLARIYAAHFGKELAGLILSGTSQLPEPVLALSDPVDAVFGKLSSNSSSGKVFYDMIGYAEKKLLKENDELAWLSQSAINRAYYREDPLCGFDAGNTLTRELIAAVVKASLRQTVTALPDGFHVMFISGAKDPVGFFGKGVIAAADMFSSAGIEPEVILYPGFRHEVLNEDDNEKVLNDILSFINNVLKTR